VANRCNIRDTLKDENNCPPCPATVLIYLSDLLSFVETENIIDETPSLASHYGAEFVKFVSARALCSGRRKPLQASGRCLVAGSLVIGASLNV